MAQSSTKTIKVGSFSELYVKGKFEVTLKKGDEESVEIEQTEVDMNNIDVKASGNKLMLKLKKNQKKEEVAVVTITYKNLEVIEATYEASINFEIIQAKHLNLKAEVNSLIKGEIQAQTLHVIVNNESKVILTGNVNSQEVTVK